MILFLCFNIADLAGKLFPLFSWNPSQLLLLILTSSRVVFFPAFYCAARFAAPPYVTGALTLLLGFSNGWAAQWGGGVVGLRWRRGPLLPAQHQAHSHWRPPLPPPM